MTSAPPSVKTFRIFPDDWLHPLPLERLYPASQPVEVDVGCGKGRFLLARAAAHPEINFLGIDRMLRRLRKVDRKAVRQGLANVRLLRCEAHYAVTYLLPAHAISTFYVFFPDPWPKKRHAHHRLFDPTFMDALHRTLVPGGAVHFATDHQPYFAAVREIVAADARFEFCPPFEPAPQERTDFELIFLPLTFIQRLSFRKKP